MKILIAGIGNIFLGDDAFGVEVANRLIRAALPNGVSVKDFGIRGLDLAYALMEDYDAFVLIDAVPRGEAPGTLYSMEIDFKSIGDAPAGEPVFDAHALHPLRVLQTVNSMGGSPKRVLLIGCEPEALGEEEQFEGRMGLSAVVEASLDEAVAMVRQTIDTIFEENTHERQKAVESSDDHGSGRADHYVAAGH